MRLLLLCLTLVLTLAPTAFAGQTPSPPRDFLLVKGAGMVVDGRGGKPLAGGAVLIQGDRILSVGQPVEMELPETNLTTLDVGNNTILPGFVDASVHLLFPGGPDLNWAMGTGRVEKLAGALDAGRKTLMAGVTSARDTFGAPAGLKHIFDSGLFPGPRLRTGLAGITGTGGGGDLANNKAGLDMTATVLGPDIPDPRADGPEAIRRTVHSLARAGADSTTLVASGLNGIPDLDKEELALAVEQSRERGLFTLAVAMTPESISQAVEAGVDGLLYGYSMDEQAAGRMLQNEVFLVPVLSCPFGEHAPGQTGLFPPPDRQAKRKAAERNIPMAVQKGVKIAMGSGAGLSCEHGTNLRELDYLVDLTGISPMQAILTATRNSAQLLGWQEDVGSLEKGKLADVVVVKNDPLEDITVLGDPDNILLVIKNGQVVKNILP